MGAPWLLFPLCVSSPGLVRLAYTLLNLAKYSNTSTMRLWVNIMERMCILSHCISWHMHNLWESFLSLSSFFLLYWLVSLYLAGHTSLGVAYCICSEAHHTINPSFWVEQSLHLCKHLSVPSLTPVFFQLVHSSRYPNSVSSTSNPFPYMVCSSFC